MDQEPVVQLPGRGVSIREHQRDLAGVYAQGPEQLDIHLMRSHAVWALNNDEADPVGRNRSPALKSSGKSAGHTDQALSSVH